MGWAEFVGSPIVVDFLWLKFSAGVELDSLVLTSREPAQVSALKRSKEGIR